MSWRNEKADYEQDENEEVEEVEEDAVEVTFSIESANPS